MDAAVGGDSYAELRPNVALEKPSKHLYLPCQIKNGGFANVKRRRLGFALCVLLVPVKLSLRATADEDRRHGALELTRHRQERTGRQTSELRYRAFDFGGEGKRSGLLGLW